MKFIIGGVAATIVIMIFMYYRKQQRKLEEKVDSRPLYNVVPEHATNRLVDRIEKLTQNFETKIEPKKRKFRLLLNSADRDIAIWPTQTEYNLKLVDKIYGLEKLTLTKATFPTTLQLINDNNNQLTISGGFVFASVVLNFAYVVSLTNGVYNTTSLASMIQTAINEEAALDATYTSPATWAVGIESATGLITFTSVTLPSHPVQGAGSALTFSVTGNSYITDVLGLSPTAADGNFTVPYSGVEPVNVSYPQNLVLYLDNGAFDFDSLRLMAKDENDRRCFAYMTVPSGNGAGGSATPSAATLSGAAILVAGSGGATGYGTYVITKEMTNAYYKAYGGKIPLLQNIHVRIRQILSDGTVVTPDFNASNHTLEFEVKANVDKISLGYNK
mgnify:CR=1 FL=1|tara:strand:+ start:14184 stop:15347 length:1164 start_codon:yes stop_codon:yes gene_type:complete